MHLFRGKRQPKWQKRQADRWMKRSDKLQALSFNFLASGFWPTAAAIFSPIPSAIPMAEVLRKQNKKKQHQFH